MGVLFTQNAFLHNGWNILELFVVIIIFLVLSPIDIGEHLTAMKSLHALSALRPLSMISKFRSIFIFYDYYL